MWAGRLCLRNAPSCCGSEDGKGRRGVFTAAPPATFSRARILLTAGGPLHSTGQSASLCRRPGCPIRLTRSLKRFRPAALQVICADLPRQARQEVLVIGAAEADQELVVRTQEVESATLRAALES